MNPQRIAIKIFSDRSVPLHELHPFIALFHRFIQEASVPGLLIDVADYAHVPDGPGVILIGHDVDYGIDRTGGRTGLLTTRKRAGNEDAAGLFRSTLAMAVATAREIAADGEIGLGFETSELQVAFPDRLAAPNNDEAAALLAKELEPTLRELLGDGVAVECVSGDDPRRMLTFRIDGGTAGPDELHTSLGGS